MVTDTCQEGDTSVESAKGNITKLEDIKFLGIDPGSSSGAWAILQGHTILEWGIGSDGPRDMTKAIERHFGEVVGCIEKVHSMPKQGIASAFSFAENYGQYQGVLLAMRVPYSFVTPQKWQKAILDFIPAKKPSKVDKEVDVATMMRLRSAEARGYKVELKAGIVNFVQRMCLHGGPDFSVKKYWGVADAICLAMYKLKEWRGL